MKGTSMISIELIRNDPDRVRDAMARRGENVPIDTILELDSKRRNTIVEADELRARRNEVSSQLGRMKERPAELIEEMRGVGSQIKALEDTLRGVEEEIRALVMTMPNLPQDDVPVGEDESGNVEVSRHGEIPTFDFEPRPHWEIGENLGIIDFERGVKMSGSRFFVLKGKGARLQRALIDWMLDLHSEQHGYQEIYLPNMPQDDVPVGEDESGNVEVSRHG
ncbi:MAG: serine--tRNA ligase, partial [Chloroflexi bacterium]|nr:serine--tRNA ligase [Chloroflexota bacterium]